MTLWLTRRTAPSTIEGKDRSMPKEATGELRTLADGFAARITIEGKNRKDCA